MIRIFSIEERKEWDEVVRSFAEYDVYYLSGYVRAFEIHGDGVPQMFYYEDNGLRGMYVYMKRKTAIDGVNRIPGCYTPMPMGAFYTVAKLPVKDAEKFCAWCLSEFRYVDEKTPKGFIGETVMMAPASGFYTDPSLGLDQVRLAYVLCKEDLQRAIMILEKAIDQYKVFEEQ